MSTSHLKTGDDFPERKEGLLRIYSMRFCPFDQRTRLVLAHKGIPNEKVFVNLKEKPEWFLSRNPVGTVPTIELPDGKILWESAIINDYLDEVYPEKKLSPDDPYEKARQRIILERASKLFQLFYKALRDPTTLNEVKAEVKVQLKMFNDLLSDTYFGGKSLSTCDFNLWPTIERYVSLNQTGKNKLLDDDFATEFPKLQKWIDAMMEIPAVKENYETPEKMTQFIQSYLDGKPTYDI